VDLHSAYHLRKPLIRWSQHCLKKLFKTVWISELVRQRVQDRRTSDRKRPTAVCVETTARCDELVSVCGTQTKPISDIRGCDEMVGEVPRCLPWRQRYIMKFTQLWFGAKKYTLKMTYSLFNIFWYSVCLNGVSLLCVIRTGTSTDGRKPMVAYIYFCAKKTLSLSLKHKLDKLILRTLITFSLAHTLCHVAFKSH